jgi:hypothetical protein
MWIASSKKVAVLKKSVRLRYRKQSEISDMTKLNDLFCGDVPNYKQLAYMLEIFWRDGKITQNQWRAAMVALCDLVPAHVSVTQRTPKSVTYFHVIGKAMVKVSNRAKVTVDYSYSENRSDM